MLKDVAKERSYQKDEFIDDQIRIRSCLIQISDWRHYEPYY